MIVFMFVFPYMFRQFMEEFCDVSFIQIGVRAVCGSIEDEAVIASAASEYICAKSANKNVITGAAINNVITIAAVYSIVATAAIEFIVAVFTIKLIVADFTINTIVTRAGMNDIVTRTCGIGIRTQSAHIPTVIAIDGIVAVTTINKVITQCCRKCAVGNGDGCVVG